MRIRFCAFVLGILLVNQMAAQTGRRLRGEGTQMSGRFYGRVVDPSNKGIEAATVMLVSNKTDTATRQRKEAIVGGMLTAPNGEFTIENVPPSGPYKLRVSGIGYKQIELAVSFDRAAGNNLSLAMSALDKDLGNIKLQIDDKVLENVTVTSTKPQLQLGIDRKIFNVEKNITSAGGTAVDVMRNVPSVNVDIDGNITLRNNAPQIFVDGRPTTLSLEQIPSDAIESVEIITNPSAKFDASGGTAGILNIVLKKQKRVGYAGNFRANIDSRGRLGTGGDINIRQKKVNFFASANLNQRRSIATGTTNRVTTDTIETRSFQRDKNIMNGTFGFARTGFDYFLNNRNTLTVSGSFVRGQMKPFATSDIDIEIDHSGPDTSYHNLRTTNGTNSFQNIGTQVSFKHNFPKAGHEWTADITYNRGQPDNSSIITSQNTLRRSPAEGGDLPFGSYSQLQNSTGVNKNLIFQTDYANVLNENAKVEMGARAAIRDLSSYLAIQFPNRSTVTRYDNVERVYAAYSTFSNRIRNFGYQLGLRAESSTNGGILNNKQSFRTDYPVSLFPSVFLSQKLSSSDDLQLNYSRRINRPNFFQLFPFTDYSDSLNISRGNPGLRPEFTNSLELSYSKSFKNRDNLIASAYFKNTNNLITRFQEREFDTLYKKDVFVSTFINANKSYVTGLELTSRNKLAQWWDLTSNINLFTAKIDLANQPEMDPFLSYFIKVNNNFRLPYNFSLQLSGDYTSRIIAAPGGSGNQGGGGHRGGGGMFWGGSSSAAQGFIRPNYGVDAAIRLDFMKAKAASLSLNVNDIFRTKVNDVHTEQAGFVQDVRRRRDPQVFRLNFNYRFGKLDANLFKRRNTRAEGNLQTDIGM